MEKQGISKFLNFLGWFFGIAGTLSSIIVGCCLDDSLIAIVIVGGIILSMVNLGLFLGLSQIITNTYNTYLNTRNINKIGNSTKISNTSSAKDELPDL